MTTLQNMENSNVDPIRGARKLLRVFVGLVWAVALLAGAVGIYQRFTQGHLPAGYGSYMPWGLWIALYFHGIGIAGGAFLLGAGGYLLDWPGFRSKVMLRSTIVLSTAAILAALMGVWLDLGHMGRAFFIMTSPNFGSMMAFNAWMYGGFLLLAAIAWLLSFRRHSDLLKAVLCPALLLAVLFPSQSGAFFGVVEGKGYWHSPLMPMMFLAAAFVAGGATLLLVRALLGPAADEQASDYAAALRRLRMAVIKALVIYFVFEFAELSIALWSPQAHVPALDLLLSGPYWWMFWIVHLLVGGLIPLLLLAIPSPRTWLLGSIFLAIAFVSGRLNVLLPGQAVGELEGLQEAFNHPRLSYVYEVTAMEYQVGLFMLAVAITIFVIGQRINHTVAARSGRS